MSVVAQHQVAGTPATVYITRTTRGFMVMSMGVPVLQKSAKAKTEADARAIANDMWRAARAWGNGRK